MFVLSRLWLILWQAYCCNQWRYH